MNAHNEALIRRLTSARDQLDMAIEDAAEDFSSAIAHAEIAETLLREIVQARRSATAA